LLIVYFDVSEPPACKSLRIEEILLIVICIAFTLSYYSASNIPTNYAANNIFLTVRLLCFPKPA